MNFTESSFKIIIGALVLGLIAQRFIPFVLLKVHSLFHFERLPVKLDPISSPLRFLIPALLVSLTLPLLNFPADIFSRLSHFIQLWVIFGIGWMATQVIVIVRNIILFKYNVTSENFYSRNTFTQIRILEHIIDFAIWLITAAIMIMTFSAARQLGMSLFASAGIAGVVIGFAAQKTLGNLLAGIQIAISQPIRLEDAVIVEGEWGWVEEITLTYVVIRIWDLRRLIVPISYFIEQPFQNWTKVSADILGTVLFYVDYMVPIDKIRAELTHILEKSTLWDKKVNVLQVTDLKEQTVELRALVSSADSGASWDLRCEVREKLLEFIKENFPEAFPRTRFELESREETVSHSHR
jgi:small-conductance mechanosensitive channel